MTCLAADNGTAAALTAGVAVLSTGTQWPPTTQGVDRGAEELAGKRSRWVAPCRSGIPGSPPDMDDALAIPGGSEFDFKTSGEDGASGDAMFARDPSHAPQGAPPASSPEPAQGASSVLDGTADDEDADDRFGLDDDEDDEFFAAGDGAAPASAPGDDFHSLPGGEATSDGDAKVVLEKDPPKPF